MGFLDEYYRRQANEYPNAALPIGGEGTQGLRQIAGPNQVMSISPNPPDPGLNKMDPYIPGTKAFTQRVDNWQPPNPLLTKPSENYMYDVGAVGPIVYHGSPYKFGKFDVNKIGVGEGTQMEGRGLYFAEALETGKSYKKQMKGRKEYFYDGVPVYELPQEQRTLIDRIVSDVPYKDPRDKSLKINMADYISKAEEKIKSGDLNQLEYITLKNMDANKIKKTYTKGHVYKAEIPDAITGEMLNLDIPLSEQPNIIKKIKGTDLETVGEFHKVNKPNGSVEVIGPYGNSLGSHNPSEVDEAIKNYKIGFARVYHGGKPADRFSDVLTGRDWFRSVESRYGPAGAAKIMQDVGIPGNKYLDAISRDRTRGVKTYNYVVFDDKHISNVSVIK